MAEYHHAKRGSGMKESDANRVNELISELAECREDERNSQNQILQVIVTAGTVLGILLGASYFSQDNENSGLYRKAIFWLSILVFGAAFAYILVLGIGNTLRYYYIQELEDRLHRLIPSGPDDRLHRLISSGPDDEGNWFLHWNSYSAPMITRNLKHISSLHALLNHIAYGAAAFCAVGFSIVMVYLLFLNIGVICWYDYLLFYISVFVMSVVAALFLSVSSRAKEMAAFSRKTALDNMKKRLAGDRENLYADAKEFLRILLYFLYPKYQDWYKAFLVVLGFAAGCFLAPEAVCADRFLALLQCLFVFELLAYRARYQINDLRGIREQKNPLRGKDGKQNPEYIRISVRIALFRIVLAILLTVLWDGPVQKPLIAALWLLLGSTILYELARWGQEALRRGKDHWEESRAGRCFAWCIYFLVGPGYPLRFFLGLSLVIPWRWTLVSGCVIAALWAYGSCSSVLSWACSVAGDMEQGQNDDSKGHFLLIRGKLKARKGQGGKPAGLLRKQGGIWDPWNFLYMIATLAASGAIWQIGGGGLEAACWELAGVLLFVCAAVAGGGEVILPLAAAGAVTVLKSFFIHPAAAGPRSLWCLYGMQLLFAGTHLFLRFFFQAQTSPEEIAKLLRGGLSWLVAGGAARDILCPPRACDGKTPLPPQEKAKGEKVEI